MGAGNEQSAEAEEAILAALKAVAKEAGLKVILPSESLCGSANARLQGLGHMQPLLERLLSPFSHCMLTFNEAMLIPSWGIVSPCLGMHRL